MKSKQIRQRFLDFFESKSHQNVPSAPIVLRDDPTLMFTNAGMNQFKEYFLGNTEAKYKRITNTQKCLRVSGKHNDLEEVGKDTYHHTMFEMLGNWSIGDYFKKEAIEWAWEFLTKELELPKADLYVTIFEGDKEDQIEKDQEAYHIWKNLVEEDKIILGNKKDNFWEMGDQGPCGPASEIHIDLRSVSEKAKIPGSQLVNHDHPQVVEIWNLVFIQFNRKANGKLEVLPAKHVDTGMGFERLCMAMQGVTSNYDTDVFTPLIKEIETITHSTYGKDEKVDIAIRVIADHVRAVAFAIADGQLPSNSGAGYVIRRILRRAIRYGFTFLNTREAFIFKLVNVLAKQMGDSFPEIQKQKILCESVIKEEENSFLRTLDQGIALLEKIMQDATTKEISGQKAFELYDTFGFPFDLTSLILSENGFTVNEADFKASLEEQKQRSKDAAASVTDDWVVLRKDDEEEFIGYDYLSTSVKITRYRKITSAKDGELYQLVFNLTPFYPEGGGQIGDKGYLESSNGETIYIIDTKKENNLIVHFAKTLPSHINDSFSAVVDEKQRLRTASNHTATHLLHQALRKVLGNHVEQKGSLVKGTGLRFDFSHFAKLTQDELKEVEDFVNARIIDGLALDEKRKIPFQEALDNGALALFGEKYGDVVRMIGFGDSKELCGGTHVQNTSEIWHFIIKQETAVAAGIRRIEAITGEVAKQYLTEQSNILSEVAQLLKNNKDIPKTVASLQTENSELRKQVEHLVDEKKKHLKQALKSKLEVSKDGVHFLIEAVDVDANAMKDISFQLGGEIDNLIVVLGSNIDDKALLSCYISKSLAKEKDLNAGQIVRELGKFIQGGGGGQAFFATAGGKNASGIPNALEAAKSLIGLSV
jgi:alanyl-tRNA synthetase